MNPFAPSRPACATACAASWLACSVAGAAVVRAEVSQMKRPFRPRANPLVATP